MDSNALQGFIDQRAEEIATEVYTQMKNDSKFNVGDVAYHVHTGVDSPQVDYENLVNKTRFVVYRLVSPTTSLSVSTSVGGAFVMPFGGYITAVGATVDIAGTTSTMTLDINKAGTTIMATTKISVASGSTTSRTNTSQPVITTAQFNTGDIFTFDVDATNTTPAQGLSIFMNLVQN